MSTGKSAKKTKITVDTNILVSVFVFPGATVVKLFDDILDGKIELGISDEILREFAGVCVRKFDYEPEDAVRIADMIRQASSVVHPAGRIDVIKDEPDNRVLECAVEFDADYIVSGDKHLLEIKKYKGIHILSPADYLRNER
jgi:putative PIN family toxin of toxin-antitoxin system